MWLPRVWRSSTCRERTKACWRSLTCGSSPRNWRFAWTRSRRQKKAHDLPLNSRHLWRCLWFPLPTFQDPILPLDDQRVRVAWKGAQSSKGPAACLAQISMHVQKRRRLTRFEIDREGIQWAGETLSGRLGIRLFASPVGIKGFLAFCLLQGPQSGSLGGGKESACDRVGGAIGSDALDVYPHSPIEGNRVQRVPLRMREVKLDRAPLYLPEDRWFAVRAVRKR